MHFSSVTFKVNEDKRLSSATNRQNTASESNSLVLHERIILRDGFIILASELIDSVGASEFVRVRIGTSVANALHESLSIVSVLGRVLLFLVKGVRCSLLLRVVLFLLFLLLFRLRLLSFLLSFLFISGSFLLSLLKFATIHKNIKRE